jgi:small GTP-binding protein
MAEKQSHQMIKLVCVGDGAVGKTSVLIKFVDNEFSEEHIPTVFDNHAKFVQHGEKLINLSLWDTAGQEDYARLRPLSYPHTDVFLVCFSLTSEVSLKNVSQKWVPELQRYIKKYNEEHGTSKVPPIVLVGNKMDIWDKAKVPEHAIKSVVDGNDMIKSYKLCSARSGDGLEDTFQEACRVALASTKPKASKKKGCVLL